MSISENSNRNKLLSYWWILGFYVPFFILAILLGLNQDNGGLRVSLGSLIPSLFILYIIIFIVQFIRNRQQKKKNVRLPLFMAMFILPASLLLWLFNINFLGSIVYCEMNQLGGQYGCGAFAGIILYFTIPQQLLLNFISSIWFLKRKLYAAIINMILILASIFSIFYLFNDNSNDNYAISIVFLLVFIGLLDLLFYMTQIFSKK